MIMITGGINMKYTAKYFKDNMPEWKRKKDAFVVQKFLSSSFFLWI